MSLLSMTGFAEAHGAHETLRWRWEVKSVNGRGFDLRLRTPPGFDSIEPAARLLASGRFRRGNVQATLTLEPQEGSRGLKVDAEALASAVQLAKRIANETGLPPARVDGLLALKGVIVQDETAIADPTERAERDAALLKSLAAAFDELVRARRTEGAKLAMHLKEMVGEIDSLTTQASETAATQPGTLRERLSNQLRELMENPPVSPERLAQEVALLASRADIREELARLHAHVEEARALLKSGEAVGRKLDFLSQEFNREANTLCSKSADTGLTRIGLALKHAIDQFREQAQNVE
ncbi:MAG: YicC family protein [Alphaproteobacteria bacterium]|nr:YicC family protein [Alphaproteobacteria bacterium]